MARAIELSLEGVRAGGGPFGALVVKSNQIIAEGKNLVTLTNDPTAHAEIVAVREACRKLQGFKLTGCEIYASCEPCPMCLAAIYWASKPAETAGGSSVESGKRDLNIFYAATRADAALAGFDDSYIYKQLAIPIPERDIRMGQLLREQALEAFRDWSAKPDKKQY